MSPYRVFVIDDFEHIVEYVRAALESDGQFQCECFTSVAPLIEKFAPGQVDAILADLKMPDLDGGELHRRISERDHALSFVVMTGHADVKTAVKLMEQGTFTLLEKPFTRDEIVGAARKAAERTIELRTRDKDRLEILGLLATLDPDENEVLDSMLLGRSNKETAFVLSISPRTLDRRRNSILAKLKVNTFAEVIAMVTRART